MTPEKTVLNIAHRGARSLAPENTLLAAKKALELGADMWELDVNITADGEMVIVHDDSLERTSNVVELFPHRDPWKVWDFTLEELRRLDFGSWFIAQDPFQQIAAGNVSKAEQQNFSGAKIPTLHEVLQFTQENNWRVNVEIKDITGVPGDKRIVERVVALIDELGMHERVLISSFNHAYIQRSKQANPLIATAALIESPVTDPVRLLKSLNAQAFNPDLALTSREMVHSLRSEGFDVNVWTVNSEVDMRELIANGVSGIITDFPQVLHRVLANF